jgi:hypothetical protein
VDSFEEKVRAMIGGFRADMKAQGMHVGEGDPPTCCVDDEPWPCSWWDKEDQDAGV